METRSRLLRIDIETDEWLQVEAKRQNRSVNAEIVTAIKHWKETRNTMLYLPEEKDLNISAKDVEWDRRTIRKYEDKIELYRDLAEASNGPRRGAYLGHITKTKRNVDAMSGNLAYHLDWLRRYRPEVYEQVK